MTAKLPSESPKEILSVAELGSSKVAETPSSRPSTSPSTTTSRDAASVHHLATGHAHTAGNELHEFSAKINTAMKSNNNSPSH